MVSLASTLRLGRAPSLCAVVITVVKSHPALIAAVTVPVTSSS